MMHQVRVIIDLVYDDENGEYLLPRLKDIERNIANGIQRPVEHMGFVTEFNVEAEEQ